MKDFIFRFSVSVCKFRGSCTCNNEQWGSSLLLDSVTNNQLGRYFAVLHQSSLTSLFYQQRIHMETFSEICFYALIHSLSLHFLKCFEFECFLKVISVYPQMLHAWKWGSEFSSTDVIKIYHCLEMQVITTQTVDALEESLAVKLTFFQTKHYALLL